ncbi:hypothetical protein [Actinokineospora bangkokensis]|nr:hypothetical protein [Actinokineospora bangkokensis]
MNGHAKIAGWRGREQNRFCCTGHDPMNYPRLTRRTEATEAAE